MLYSKPLLLPLSVIFESSWYSDDVPGDWEKGTIIPILQRGWRKILWTTDWKTHFCAWESHGAGLHENVKTHLRQGGDPRHPTQLN